MQKENIRCTYCGHSETREINLEEVLQCFSCDEAIILKQAVTFGKRSDQEGAELSKLRDNLQRVILAEDDSSILKYSQDILTLIPNDYSALYYEAYVQNKQGQTKALHDFYESTNDEKTTKELENVVNHILTHFVLTHYNKANAFMKRESPQTCDELNRLYKERKQKEEDYAVVPRQVFICHKSEDFDVVRKVSDTIEKDGNKCWYSERNLRPNDGQNYWRNIEDAIDNATIFLVISSDIAMLSKDVQREIQYANKKNKKKIEYKIDDSVHTSLFKHSFDGIKWIDASRSDQLEQIKQRVFFSLNEENSEKKTDLYKVSAEIKSKIIPKQEKRTSKKLLAITSILIIISIISIIFYTNSYSVKFEQINMGYSHNLLLSKEGDLYAFGNNEYGQLGLGKKSSRISEVTLVEINLNSDEKIIDLQVGWNFSVILTNKGRVLTWGDNSIYQLGLGQTTLYEDSPYDITNFFKSKMDLDETIIQIKSGAFSSLALTNKNRVLTWGSGFAYGLAVEPFTDQDFYFPEDATKSFELNSNEKIIKIQASGTNFGLLTNFGKVYIWGTDPQGQNFLGNNALQYIAKPLNITLSFPNLNSDKVIDFHISNTFVLFMTEKNKTYSLGKNYASQLGYHSKEDTFIPVEITNLLGLQNGEKISNVFLGYDFAYLMTSFGNVYTWGSNIYNSIQQTDVETKFGITKTNLGLSDVIDMSFSVSENIYAYINSDFELFIWGNPSIIINGKNLSNIPKKLKTR